MDPLVLYVFSIECCVIWSSTYGSIGTLCVLYRVLCNLKITQHYREHIEQYREHIEYQWIHRLRTMIPFGINVFISYTLAGNGIKSLNSSI